MFARDSSSVYNLFLKEKFGVQLEVLRVIEEFKNVNLENPESSFIKQKKGMLNLKTLINLVKEGIVVNTFKETSLAKICHIGH